MKKLISSVTKKAIAGNPKKRLRPEIYYTEKMISEQKVLMILMHSYELRVCYKVRIGGNQNEN